MTEYSVDRATGDDAVNIAANLRALDRQELSATSLKTPEESLRLSVEVSRDAWAGKIDGVPACLFGVFTPGVISDHGFPWFYGTTLLAGHERAFLRRCKPWVREAVGVYGELRNWVDVRNRKAVLWLRWLGFDVSEEIVKLGPKKMSFHPYSMKVKK